MGWTRRTVLTASLATLVGGCVDRLPGRQPPCADHTLHEGDSLEYEHYGTWTAVAVDGEAGAVALWWTAGVDHTDELAWDAGTTVERDGEAFTVEVDDALVLVDASDGRRRYEEGDEVAYHRNTWRVDDVADDRVRLAWARGPDHVKADLASGRETTIAGNATRYTSTRTMSSACARSSERA